MPTQWRLHAPNPARARLAIPGQLKRVECRDEQTRPIDAREGGPSGILSPGGARRRSGRLLAGGVGVGGVSEAVSHEVEGEDGEYDEQAGRQQPRGVGDRLEVLRLENSTPQLMAGWRKPSPRKLSAVSAMMMARVVVAMMSLMNVGSMWRNMRRSWLDRTGCRATRRGSG